MLVATLLHNLSLPRLRRLTSRSAQGLPVPRTPALRNLSLCGICRCTATFKRTQLIAAEHSPPLPPALHDGVSDVEHLEHLGIVRHLSSTGLSHNGDRSEMLVCSSDRD